ncbi:MAG TPA: TonB-dependent receptor, partial [Bryobacteraceae bacterium]|nr:TonB-dependent receptor [Bryobacteraceae bacterium]
MGPRRFGLICVAAFCWSFLLAAGCFAQIRSGTLVGRVSDSSGAAVPGADITLREVDTNQTYTLTTNSAGEYTQPYLPAGRYEVTVSKTGFDTVTQRGITLSTAQTLRADILLQVGRLATEVTVVGATAAELQTDSSHVTNAVGAETIAALPNINNNALNYASLQQGVVARAAMNDTQTINSFGVGTEGRRTFADFQINGGTAFTNDVQMDGVSVMASAWNEVSILPITDGIQEVRTTINNMSAEYGRSQGTVIISTKSGTNQFHGSAGYRIRNEALNANTFANNASQPYTPRAPFKNNAFSATFGGPVILPKIYNGKDRTFFFVSYEGFRFKTGVDYFRTVPTALERMGDFSQTRAQVGSTFAPVSIYDPFNVTTISSNTYQRMPFPNAIIPESRVNPILKNVVGEYPLPNRTPDDPTGVNNFYNRMQRKLVRDAVNMRFDHRQGQHALYGTFGNNLGDIDSPNGWGDQTRYFSAAGMGPVNGDRNYYASLGDTWVLSPTLIADVRVGLTRVAADNRAKTYNDVDYTQWGISPAWYGAIGLAGTLPEVASTGGGFSRLSALNQTGYLGKVERQTNWNLVGSVTKTAGRWTHRWGGEFRNYLGNYLDARGSFNLVSSQNYTSGNTIGPLANNIDSVTAEKSGSGLASMLLGAGNVAAGENAVRMALSAKYAAVYQQSDWRVTDRLTLNLGLRYDIQQAPTERYNRMSAFSYEGQTFGTPGHLVFPGTSGMDRNLWKTPWHDFGPRFGVAYRASESLVVRSGFGVNYLPTNTGHFGGPYYYGNQNFAPTVTPQTALQYGNSPAGALLAPYNQVVALIPAIGANPNAPQYYGAGSNEPRFDYEAMKNGKVLQWNFFIEKRIKGGLLSAGYTGTHAYRLQVGRMNVNDTQLLSSSLLAAWRTAYINSNGTNPATLLSPNPYQ